MLVRCLSALIYRGRIHPIGTELEIEDEGGARLIEAGKVQACAKARASEPKPAAEPTDDKPAPKPKAARKKAPRKKAPKK